uniref:hypothetical protein n=1 Tax=Pseudomonas sp. MC1 TaxID=1123041 RepID=UPI0015656D4E|nr:hypothetical protein [Pseudomonas sp. MC1]
MERAVGRHGLLIREARFAGHALQSAARLAELHKKWYSAAELYEAAASIWPGNGLSYMRKAEQCRSLVDSARDEMDL